MRQLVFSFCIIALLFSCNNKKETKPGSTITDSSAVSKDSVISGNSSAHSSNSDCSYFIGKWVTKGTSEVRSITISHNGQWDVQSFDGIGMTIGCRNIICNGSSLSVTDKAQGNNETIYLKSDGDVKYLEVPTHNSMSAFCGGCKYYKSE